MKRIVSLVPAYSDTTKSAVCGGWCVLSLDANGSLYPDKLGVLESKGDDCVRFLKDIGPSLKCEEGFTRVVFEKPNILQPHITKTQAFHIGERANLMSVIPAVFGVAVQVVRPSAWRKHVGLDERGQHASHLAGLAWRGINTMTPGWPAACAAALMGRWYLSKELTK